MASQCFICATEFSFFKKEYGCANCGHAVCKKCCSKKAVVPKLGTHPQHVCTKCYERLTHPNSEVQNRENMARYSPPLNFKKRLEAQASGGTSTGIDSARSAHCTPPHHSGGQLKYKGMSPKDQEIAERLEKLKSERRKERGYVPSTSEMEERLAKLKGMDPEVFKQPSKPVYQPPDNRTFQDQFNDLFTEISDEVTLDAKIAGQTQDDDKTSIDDAPQEQIHQDGRTTQAENSQENPEEKSKRLAAEADKLIEETKRQIKLAEGKKSIEQEVEERLGRLRSNDGVTPIGEATACPTNIDDDDLSEEELRKRVIKAIMDEDALDKKVRSEGYGDLLEKALRRDIPIDPDELPWCSICNNDAILRCQGCDNELFCKRCFGLGHDRIDRHDHKTTPYPPSGIQQ
uniref:Zinc finger FYVE domain-containing protein 19-like n=1 Tax=Saccoglossus kowalevskii TaxID=10224 RepID=A0ABM0M2Q0_SACKO|nr:PREDICTED: zinc finger FYVE domain-containing protein 19-like [Saccoglossus kowalevskii]